MQSIGETNCKLLTSTLAAEIVNNVAFILFSESRTVQVM